MKNKSFNTIFDSSKYNNFDQTDKQKDFKHSKIENIKIVEHAC